MDIVSIAMARVLAPVNQEVITATRVVVSAFQLLIQILLLTIGIVFYNEEGTAHERDRQKQRPYIEAKKVKKQASKDRERIRSRPGKSIHTKKFMDVILNPEESKITKSGAKGKKKESEGQDEGKGGSSKDAKDKDPKGKGKGKK